MLISYLKKKAIFLKCGFNTVPPHMYSEFSHFRKAKGSRKAEARKLEFQDCRNGNNIIMGTEKRGNRWEFHARIAAAK